MPEFNAVFREFFPDAHPARTTVGVALCGVPLEIDCVAVLRPAPPAVRPVAPAAERWREVGVPTLGHFLEDGFVDHGIQAVVEGVRLVGRAVTLSLPTPDAVAVNRAICALRPGDALVIDTGGNRTHAVLGAVTATAIHAVGAAGVVVDGLVTDRADLRRIGLPVFARGTTARTTKLLDDGRGELDAVVRCGGVQVRPGDLVLADDNGVLVVDPDSAGAADALDRARRSDADEPAVLARLLAGEHPRDVLTLRAPSVTTDHRAEGALSAPSS